MARIGRADLRAGERGTVIATGYAHGFPVASAFTVGSVIITRHPADWLDARPRLLVHEERHTWQYAACLGLPLVPLYLASMAYSQWRTGDRAAANPFERLAGLADGAYRVPTAAEVAGLRQRRRERLRALVSRPAR